MKHARKTALAASAFTCAALLSFGWSEQGGISLSIESAQARVGRPLTPVSVAGVARRGARATAVNPSAAWGGVSSSDSAQYIKNLHDSGYNPKNNFNANGTIKTQ